LCEEAEKLSQASPPDTPILPQEAQQETGAEQFDTITATTSIQAPSPITSKHALRQRLGFEPSQRTVSYCLRRIKEHAKFNQIQLGVIDIPTILSDEILGEYKKIYTDVCGIDPFSATSASDRDDNVVPLINFALFSMVFPIETTREQLISVISKGKRPGQGFCTGVVTDEHPERPTNTSSGHK
jgi:hypothetical protein